MFPSPMNPYPFLGNHLSKVREIDFVAVASEGFAAIFTTRHPGEYPLKVWCFLIGFGGSLGGGFKHFFTPREMTQFDKKKSDG